MLVDALANTIFSADGEESVKLRQVIVFTEALTALLVAAVAAGKRRRRRRAARLAEQLRNVLFTNAARPLK